MSKDTETRHQATNSYTSITRSAGPSKTGCAKCEAKKLPFCMCSKSSSEENDPEEECSDPAEETKNINLIQQTDHFFTPSTEELDEEEKEEPILLLSGPEHKFQFILKPNIKLTDIKALLEQFIKELAHNVDDDVNIKELGKKLGIYYDDTQENSLAITMKNPEHFVEFFSRLRDKDLIVVKQDQAQKIENITPEENCQSFNPSPFKMTLTPY